MMPQNTTQGRVDWVNSTVRQMKMAGQEPSSYVNTAFFEYIDHKITFYQLLSILKEDS